MRIAVSGGIICRANKLLGGHRLNVGYDKGYGELMLRKKLEYSISGCLGLSLCSFNISMAVGNIFLGFVILLSAVYIWKFWDQIEYPKNAVLYHKIYGLFMLFIAFAVPFSIDITESIVVFGEIFIWRYLLFVIVLACINNKQALINIVIAFMAYFSVNSVISVYQVVVLHFQRGFGFGGGLLTFAGVCCMLIPVILISALDDSVNRRLKTASYGSALFIVAGLLSSKSRGAWLTNAVSFFPIITTYIKRSKVMAGKICLVVMVLMGIFFAQPTLVNRLYSTTNITTDRSNGDRIEVWKSAFQMVKDYPVAGVGLAEFKTVYNEYGYKSEKETQGLAHTHNNILQIAVENGAMGVAGYMIFIIGTMVIMGRQWKQSKSPYLLMSMFIFINYLVLFGQIEYTFDNSFGMKLMWALMAVLVKLAWIEDKEKV